MTDIIGWAVTVYSRIKLNFSRKREIHSSVRENIVLKGKLVGSFRAQKKFALFFYIYSELYHEFNG